MRPLIALALSLATACGTPSSGSDTTSTSASGAAGGGGGPVGGGGPSGGGGSGGTAPEPDPCLGTRPRCPVVPADPAEGSGLLPIDRCAFPMRQMGFESRAVDGLADELPSRSLADVLADLNRDATTVATVAGDPDDVSQAFAWNDGDQNVTYWIPQGLTGSADASPDGLVAGREVVLASWYYDIDADPGSSGEKGVRVSLADVTDPTSVAYRHLLLVEPYIDGEQVDFRAVTIHAGGLAWLGDRLYVADTTHGFRVFDTSRILEVATGSLSIGHVPSDGAFYAANYKYIVPQIGHYEREGDCDPRFSFVALDRSTTPPSLVSGEYDATTITGRIYHWSLTADHELNAPVSFPGAAYFAMHSHLQGAVSQGPSHWLSSSEPPAGHGALYLAAEGANSTVVPWVDAPEDLMLDAGRGKLWSQSEGQGARYVFAVSPPP